jgi:hypothetical protein
MAAQAWPAQGSTIGIDEAYPPGGTYTLIGEVLSLGKVGGGEVGERDTTVLVSTVKTNAPTIPDNGEVSISLNFDPTDAVHKFLRGLKDTPPSTPGSQFNNFQVTFNDPAGSPTPTHDKATFAAWVKTFDGVNAEDTDSNLTADVTLRVTGAVTWTNA